MYFYLKPNPQGKPKHTQVPQCSTHLCGPQQRQRLPRGLPGYRQPPGPLPSALQTVGNRAGAAALQCVQMGGPYSAVLPCPAPPAGLTTWTMGLWTQGYFESRSLWHNGSYSVCRRELPSTQKIIVSMHVGLEFEQEVALSWKRFIIAENYNFFLCHITRCTEGSERGKLCVHCLQNAKATSGTWPSSEPASCLEIIMPHEES